MSKAQPRAPRFPTQWGLSVAAPLADGDLVHCAGKPEAGWELSQTRHRSPGKPMGADEVWPPPVIATTPAEPGAVETATSFLRWVGVEERVNELVDRSRS